jgi:hypothetical protein
VKAGGLLSSTINWTAIKQKVATVMHCNHHYVRKLQTCLFEDGDLSSLNYDENVENFSQFSDDNDDDIDNDNCIFMNKDNNQTLSKQELEVLIAEVEQRHLKGKQLHKR